MERTLKSLVLSLVLATAASACAIGLGVGAWCLIDGSAAGTFVLRGGLTLGLVVLVALVPAVALLVVLRRSAAAIGQAITDLRQGRVPRALEHGAVKEWNAASDGLVELGQALEEERKRSERDSANRARSLRTEALRRFADGVAREVQKPLSGVIGFAEIAARQQGVQGQLKNYLTMIEQEARSGREALDRVLRFARDEEFPTEPLDINQLLVRASQALVSAEERERIRLQLNLAEDLPKVLGDGGQLMQVFTSLLANAREAMLPDGGTIELSTNTDDGGLVVVMIRDSGRGIPVEFQDRVFTPFFTSKGTRKGAGLSLAVAESVIRRHSGRIEFFSTPGGGTVFFLHLRPEGAEHSSS
jgi:signal transduction histidine kinase